MVTAMYTTVTNAQELTEALASGKTDISIQGTISGIPSITLPEGVSLSGGKLEFLAKGIRLTKNNTLSDITVTTSVHEVAIYNATDLVDAGTLALNNVTTVGQIYLVAQDELMSVRVEASNVHVAEADVRGRVEQPHGYGVDVLQGGLTLWNRQPHKESTFTATLDGISVGMPNTPVRGSGVFVAGYGDRDGKPAGGLFTADLIRTGLIHTDGGIAPGTPDKISGGVFVVSAAEVDTVENVGDVTTRGQNDMVLDNWGQVNHWRAKANIMSTGPSGIGFVNFGDIHRLEIEAPIVTTGVGARAFNLYDGTLDEAIFDSIVTHGNGSIGIQVSKPMGSLTVKGNVETTGSEGMSLVKGVQMTLKAIALSVKDGGEIDHINIGGALRTRGADVTTYEVTEKGIVRDLHIGGGIEALGENSRIADIHGDSPQP